MMVQVSALLARSTSGLPEIGHDVLIDPEGPALAAILIGGLLEGAQTPEELTRKFMTDLLAHIRGRKGGEISQTDLALASASRDRIARKPRRSLARLRHLRRRTPDCFVGAASGTRLGRDTRLVGRK